MVSKERYKSTKALDEREGGSRVARRVEGDGGRCVVEVLQALGLDPCLIAQATSKRAFSNEVNNLDDELLGPPYGMLGLRSLKDKVVGERSPSVFLGQPIASSSSSFEESQGGLSKSRSCLLSPSGS